MGKRTTETAVNAKKSNKIHEVLNGSSKASTPIIKRRPFAQMTFDLLGPWMTPQQKEQSRELVHLAAELDGDLPRFNPRLSRRRRPRRYRPARSLRGKIDVEDSSQQGQSSTVGGVQIFGLVMETVWKTLEGRRYLN